jgi:putative transposase
VRFLAQVELDSREVLKAFIDQHRDTFGLEPICKVLRIAPSGYRRHAAQLRDPSRRCVRAIRDERLRPEIRRVWQANMRV